MYYRLLAGEKLEASKKPVDSTFGNWSQLELLIEYLSSAQTANIFHRGFP